MPCIFCAREFTKSNPDTVEHVLKRSWMKALGHANTPMPGQLFRGESIVREIPASRPAMELVVGKICQFCNGGWMEQVDSSVGEELLSLARAETKLGNLSSDARFRFARWALKTACVLRHSSPKNYRHVPTGIMASCHLPDYLPRGFIAFAHQLAPGTKGLNASSMDSWIRHNGRIGAVSLTPQSQRLKAAFQFDSLVVGCSWVASHGVPCFKVYPGIHEVLLVRDARVNAYSPWDQLAVGDVISSTPNVTHALQFSLNCDIEPFIAA